jgi:predicted ATPase
VIKTEGVPLFVEELTQMVLASGWLQEQEDHYELTGPVPPLVIPPTVHDSIVARLEQLWAAKAVAQVGAVWGRGFTEVQLQAVAPLDRRRLEQALTRLVAADILQEASLSPRLTYIFKHALIQEAAYASMPPDLRRQSHQRVAQVLEEQFPGTVETQPELLAHHYTEAGLTEPAIDHWHKAGQRATQRSAYVEAMAHLTRGLQLLTALPDTPVRLQHELTLRLALAVPLMATRGYAAPDLEHVYTRIREICQHIGDTPQLPSVLSGLRRLYMARGSFQLACEVGEQLLQLAQRQHDPVIQLWGHIGVGPPLYYLGEFTTARAHIEQGIALYDALHYRTLSPRSGADPLVSYGTDPLVNLLSHLSSILWFLGYPDQSLRQSQAALALAQELAAPFSLAMGLSMAGPLHQNRREPQAAQEQAEALIALSTAQGFAHYLPIGTMVQGWVLCTQGQSGMGLAQVQRGLTAYRATGTKMALPYYLSLLAEAYGYNGQPAEGRRVLAEAQAVVHTTGERVWEAELHRLKGELLLRQAVPDEFRAEACFQQALAVARRQQAKMLELRAALSLGRLWQRQGKRDKARQRLAEVYGWFTEGFDTVDLQEARALLEALTDAASGFRRGMEKD